MAIGELASGTGLTEVSGVNAVTGDRSTLKIVNNMLWVGDFGRGTLNVKNGGLVDIKTSLAVGGESTGQGLVSVDGVDQATGIRSEITALDVTVGNQSKGQLDITNGGRVSATSYIDIGEYANIVGVINVDGIAPGTNTRSTLTTADDLNVGWLGKATLNVSNGGVVNSNKGYLSYLAGSQGTVTISGDDGNGNASIWTNAGELDVGRAGTGALFIKDGGAVVNDGISYIANLAGSHGEVTVSGQGGSGSASSWINNNDLVISQFGTGSLTIQDGGVVSNASGYIGASASVAGVKGTVIVSGRGSKGVASTWTNAGNLLVGDEGTGELIIQDGGAVSAGDISYVGRNVGSHGTVTVSGQDGSGNASSWTNSNDLVIGQFGTGILDITDGGAVDNETGYIGASGGSLGTVTVSGVGSNGAASTWTNRGDLIVGDAGTGTLTVQHGGLVNVNGSLQVGFDGTGTLNITSGGKAVSDTGNIGNGAGTSQTLVTGTGSSWEATGRITVGVFGAGTLRIEDGAMVSSNDGIIGSGAHGDAVVTGAGTTWTNDQQLNVGSFGSGTLRIEAGASVISNQGYIGANDVGSVVVTGAGSNWWVNTYTMTVGNDGNGTLTIEDGGRVRVEGGLRLGSGAAASGTLTLQGTAANRAVLETYGLTAGLGTVDVSIDGGLLRALYDNGTFFDGFDGRDITLGANGVVVDTQGYNIFVSPRFVGNGALTKDGTGWLVLTGANIYTGGTTILAGSLQLGDGNTSGSILGDVANDGMLMFYRSDDMVFDGTISGSGSVSQAGAGTTTLIATNSYTGGTSIIGGTLQLGNSGTTGSILGDVANDGILAFDRSDDVTFSGLISGSGAVDHRSAARLILTADNSYAGGTTISAGALQLGTGGTTGSIVGDVANNGSLVFDRSDDIGFDGLVSGTGSLVKNGAGILTLTDANSYAGATSVNAGTLRVNGDQSTATGLTTVFSGATLGGSGIIGGNVDVRDGGILAPGNSPGMLTINGNLTLAGGSILKYEFGHANVAGGPLNDLVDVGGNLVLDGTLNVNVPAGGSFGAGIYRVLNYSGTLTDNGLELGTMPVGSEVFVQTVAAHQVNLVNTAGLALRFWDGPSGPKNDGVIQGGTGTWRLGGGSNDWTEKTLAVNADYAQDAFAVFMGAAGTVTVDNSAGNVRASGLQFAIDRYVIAGGPLTLSGTTADVRVGAGSAADVGMTATIVAELAGAAGLNKADLGTLVLTGANSYNGGTTISAGRLQLGAGGTTGSIVGDVVNNGVLVFDRSDEVTFGGQISGTGNVDQRGGGTTVLTADNSYAGDTKISTGTLRLGDGGMTGSIVGDVVDNGMLVFDRSNELRFAGIISGTGSVTQTGSGTTILIGNNSYSGVTDVTGGGLIVNGDQTAATGLTSIGSGATLGGSGTIGGNVVMAGGGALNPGDTGAAPGTLTIKGSLDFAGSSTLNINLGRVNVVGGALNDLVNVSGNLVLDGVLNVQASAGGSFDPGIYRVINYTGTLTNNGLAIGAIPAPNVYVQTSVAHQVNLVNTGGLVFRFWDGMGTKNDGIINGGNGLWQRFTGNDNWVDDGSIPNAPFADSAFAVFMGAAGNVAVDKGLGPVNASGMQFLTDGYMIRGDDINLTGTQATIRVGDGTALGADITATIGAALMGSAGVTKADLGTLILTGDNSYAGGTAINGGVLQIAANANLGDGTGGLSFDGGRLRTTANIASDRIVSLAGNGTLDTDTGTLLVLNGTISGSGGLAKDGAGTLNLLGANSYTGGTIIAAGTLRINGDQSAATGLTTVSSGGTLAGSGIIGGDVQVASGGILAPGNSPGTLTIDGRLSLAGSSILNFEFGEAGVAGGALNDLINVGGELVLDGTLNVHVSAGGAFGPGIYRVFNYSGGLTDNGLTLGAMPAGSLNTVQTSVAGQVNLVNAGGLALNFWDGNAGPKFNNALDGGSGVWQNGTGNNNWADANGAVNAVYADGGFAVFQGAGGTVTIDDSLGVVSASGMQFASDGYTITGDALVLTGTRATIRVGDGTTAGTGFITTSLTGSAQLVKTDAGTLVLSGTNSYTGGTAISGGTVRISADANLGAAAGGLGFDGGTLNTTADLTSNRAVAFAGTGTLATEAGTTLTLGGRLLGAGALIKAGAGTLVLTGDGSGYAGPARVDAGTLSVNGVLGGSMTVNAGGRLQGTGRVGGTTNSGVVAPGFGSAMGTLTVQGDYTGNGGRLEITTVLGDDSSPTSRLLVTGATSGTTEVEVINRGGLGGQTVEGIKFVDVTGVSNGRFVLDGDYVFHGDQVVIAGAYGYRLYQGGVSNPADGDWYLRSALLDPGRPGSHGPNEPRVPLYQPGVPVYEDYIANLQSLNALPTLQQRVGNRSWAAGADPEGNGIWGRMEVTRNRADAALSTSGSDQNVDSWKMQLGADRVLAGTGKSERLVAGITAYYGQANSQVHSVFGNGTVKTDGYGLGAALTWYGLLGFYVDGQAQVSRYRSDLKSAILGMLARDNVGRGEAVSLEFGKRTSISAALSVTPQIQMAYSNVRFDRFTDPAGATVATGKGDSLKTRWGVSLDHQREWKNGRSHVYGLVNLNYEWLGGARALVSGTPIDHTDEQLWSELGVGASMAWSKGVTLYGEVSGASPIHDFGDSYTLKGNVGMRLQF